MIIRILTGLVGAFYIYLGSTFLIDPVQSGGEFGLAATGTNGLSSLRADFAAIFWVTGGSLLIAAWRQRGDVALVAAALMGIVLGVRGVSLVADGFYDGWFVPMIAEAVTVAIALLAFKQMSTD